MPCRRKAYKNSKKVRAQGGDKMEECTDEEKSMSQTEKNTDQITSRESCCTHKIKERTQQEYKSLIHRLNRIEGQVRGIRKMVEKDAYCTDILIQVEAVNAALNSFNKELLADHIKTCVTRDILDGKEETVDELLAVLQKLMK